MDSTPVRIALDVNGERREVAAAPHRTLLDVLREDLELTGAKKVCDFGHCGACTVLVDGRAAYACLQLAIDCTGYAIETVEGLARTGDLHPVQRALIAADAFQCGYCTPGQVMTLKGLLHDKPRPTRADIVAALSGNLCRCGAYPNLIRAGHIAAALQERAAPAHDDA